MKRLMLYYVWEQGNQSVSDVLFPAFCCWSMGILVNSSSSYSMQFTDHSCVQFASQVSPWWWKGCYSQSPGIPSSHFHAPYFHILFLIFHFPLFFSNPTENSKRQESKSGHPWICRQGSYITKSQKLHFYTFVTLFFTHES